MIEIKVTITADETIKATLETIAKILNKSILVLSQEKLEQEDEQITAPKRTAIPVNKGKATPQALKPAEAATAAQKGNKTDSPTLEELRGLLAAAKREKGTDAIKAVLNSYGVKLLSDLDPKFYAEVANKVENL